VEAKTIADVLTALEGQIVTVVNPQSYTRTLTGYRVDVETYNAKVISFTDGCLKMLTEYVPDPHKKVKEKVYQFVGLENIKRLGISKTEKFVFL
jgi:hypothetical protein